MILSRTSGMPKTGEFKTGEGPSGDIAALVLAAATQTLNLNTPSPAVGYDVWAVAGNPIGENTTETATWQTLTIRSRVTTTTLLNNIRALKTDEAQVDILNTDSGGFVAVDRANGANTFELIPPVYRQPLRETGDVHVSRYEEDLVSQSVDEWDVELEFVKDANRTDTPSISETAAATEWELVTPLGTIATDRVDAEFLGTGADGVERFELTARLTFEESHAWEAAYNQQAGVRVRLIPDETNKAVDDTTSASQTLGVTAPTSGSEVPSGDYVVMGWESTRLNDAYQQLTVTIADAG